MTSHAPPSWSSPLAAIPPAGRLSPQAGLARAALHELYAAQEADAAGVTGVALAFARLARPRAPILWVRQGFLDREAGAPYPPGLAEFGLDPAMLTLVRAQDVQGVLQAGLEGARCAALGAVMIELWGEAKALDLTASRRLALAAKASGTPALMVRIAATPIASAAETRWLVRAAPSRAMAANAPGNPAFSLTLLRHRGGLEHGEWHLEWDRDHGCFADRSLAAATERQPRHDPPLSGAVVPVPADRPGAQGRGATAVRHAG